MLDTPAYFTDQHICWDTRAGSAARREGASQNRRGRRPEPLGAAASLPCRVELLDPAGAVASASSSVRASGVALPGRCHGRALTQQLAHHLRGGGWYKRLADDGPFAQPLPLVLAPIVRVGGQEAEGDLGVQLPEPFRQVRIFK